jgi:hypothetical protein
LWGDHSCGSIVALFRVTRLKSTNRRSERILGLVLVILSTKKRRFPMDLCGCATMKSLAFLLGPSFQGNRKQNALNAHSMDLRLWLCDHENNVTRLPLDPSIQGNRLCR